LDFRCRKAGFTLQPLDFQRNEFATALIVTHCKTSPRLHCNLPTHAELGFPTTDWMFSGVMYLDRAVPLAWSKYRAK
jgi:hypothetical protein